MVKANEGKTSPMMVQYQTIKAENPDALLLFRLGDFYELFGEDAKEASHLLEITLTARASGEGRANKIPMCGVPHHAAETYINRLLKMGRKVAVVEQVEDPKKAKGMVKRELVRIITPGTQLSPECLNAKQNNYLVVLYAENHQFGLAAADLSTGEFIVTEFKGEKARDDLMTEISRLQPSEIVVPDDLGVQLKQMISADGNAYLTELESFRFDPVSGKINLQEYFQVASLDGFGCGDLTLAIGSAAAALYYLTQTQRGTLKHMRNLSAYSVDVHMGMDNATIRNLELVRNTLDATQKHTLLEVLDYTRTAMGGRKLRRWLLRPLLALEEIQTRQSAVAELSETIKTRDDLATVLGRMHDMERLSGRIGAQTANPRDVIALGNTLSQLPEIKAVLRLCKSSLLSEVVTQMPECSEICALIRQSVAENPPPTIKDGGFIRDGYHAEVDVLRSLSREGKHTIATLQAQEREKTGINTLKVEYNNVFGYYIEVSKANAQRVPEHYQRKQTLVNAERYITPELKEYEQKVLGAQEKLVELEKVLFIEIRESIAKQIDTILSAARTVAGLDALLSLAECAVQNNYIRPQVGNDDSLKIIAGRHPVVEKLTGEKFIPNDVLLDNTTQQVIIITGPNMAGKSTYLRQIGLIVIMAQIGSFVPAQSAQIGIIDRVFTRVGAADNLAGGQSTFMVEMNETANILNNATKKSLVILDEVGRGTSTFDGVSIAWAVAEHLHDRVGAKTLFATHYYELTELALSNSRIKNFNIAVREWKEEIIFLRKIVEGSADRSYGIQVARLAGLPAEVIGRSKEVLLNLEKANYTETGKSRLAFHNQAGTEKESPQGSLFEKNNYQAIIDALRSISPDRMTPLESLNYLSQLHAKLKP